MAEPLWPKPQEVPKNGIASPSKDFWERQLIEEGWGVDKESDKYTPPDVHLLGFIERYKDEIGPRILDIGSGPGRNLVPLAQRGFHLTGLELTEAGIEITKKRLAEERIEAKLVQGSFTDMSKLPDSSFDTLISVQTMQHGNWESAKAGFSEATRVLKPDGLFFLRIKSDQDEPHEGEVTIPDTGMTRSREKNGNVEMYHYFTRAELQELADINGLDILECVDEKKQREDGTWAPGQWNVVLRIKLTEK